MKPKKPVVAVCLCVCVAALSGCVRLWKENIDIKTYMVQAGRQAEAVPRALADKLWIDPVNVLPPFDVRNLVLRESDVEFSTSYYTELLMSPENNFRSQFYAWFSASGIFGQVSVVGRSGMSHSMVATVLEFYGDKPSNEAVLRIRVTLLDDRAKGNPVLFSKDYAERVGIAALAAEDLVRAYNTALGAILAECEKDVVAALE
jgi:ABC-type uncharacterized transport system auxiliary subunit